MEGFPSPDAKTIMEAMQDDESERTSANLSEDERQDREICLAGAAGLLSRTSEES